MKKTIFTAAMTAMIFCAYHAQGQTRGRGVLTDNGTCTANGTGGDCSDTYIGSAAGSLNGGLRNTFLGAEAGKNNKPTADNVAVGYQSLYTQTFNSTFSTYNVAIGNYALFTNNPTVASSNGWKNTAVGHNAGFSNTTASENVFLGYQAGFTNTTGGKNLFSGFEAGYSNTTASENVFQGYHAGFSNTTGNYNTFTGFEAGFSNGTGADWNTFYGWNAGRANTTGDVNVFIGANAGTNTTVSYNTFVGTNAGQNNISGQWNTMVGHSAGKNSTGTNNVYMGVSAGVTATSGDFNTYLGNEAGYWSNTADNNTAVGASASYSVTSGSQNVSVGSLAGYNNTTGSNNTCVGYGADVGAAASSNRGAFGNGAVNNQGDNTIWLGNSTANAIWVAAGGSYNVSDGRFKFNVKEGVKGLEFINKLRPVTYQMNTEQLEDFKIKNMPDSIKALHKDGVDFTESKNRIYAGFIAQEVKKATDECGFACSIVSVPADSNISNYGMNYAEIVVPLVKSVQELSKTVDSLKSVLSAFGSNRTQNGNGSGSSTTQTDVTLANRQIVLDQNAPNPFKEQTTITYELKTDFSTAAIIFTDISGNVIKEVSINDKGKGQINVFAPDLTSGIYTYYIVVDGKTIQTQKMVKE